MQLLSNSQPSSDPALRWTLAGHDHLIGGLVGLANGHTLASSSEDGTIRIWDLRTGTCLRVMTDHDGPVNTLALAQDGRLISASDDCTIRLWDPYTGACLSVLRGHEDYVNTLAASPDGRLLSAGRNGEVLLWDLAAPVLLHRFPGHGAWVVGAAISPDGALGVTTAIDNTIRAWDLRRLVSARALFHSGPGEVHFIAEGVFLPKKNNRHAGHKSYARALCFTPDGQTLISAGDKVIAWDVTTRHPKAQAHGDGWFIRGMTWLPDGRLATGGKGIQLRVGVKETSRLHGHTMPLHALAAVGPWLASGGEDRVVRIWDPSAPGVVGHIDQVSTLMFQGQNLLSAAGDGVVKVWSRETGAPLRTLRGLTQPHVDLHAAVNGQVFATANDELAVWNPDTGQCLHHFQSTPHFGFRKVIPLGRQVVAVAPLRQVTLWDLAAGYPQTFSGDGIGQDLLHLLEDGRHLLTVAGYQPEEGPGFVQLWSLLSRKMLSRVELDEEHGVVALVDEKHALVGGSKGGLYRLRLDPLSVVERVNLGSKPLKRLQVLRPGLAVGVTRTGHIHAWSTADLQDTRQMGRLPIRVRTCAIDGGLLAAIWGRRLLVWSLEQQRLLGSFAAHETLSAVAVSGRHVAVGDQRGRVYLLALPAAPRGG